MVSINFHYYFFTLSQKSGEASFFLYNYVDTTKRLVKGAGHFVHDVLIKTFFCLGCFFFHCYPMILFTVKETLDLLVTDYQFLNIHVHRSDTVYRIIQTMLCVRN